MRFLIPLGKIIFNEPLSVIADGLLLLNLTSLILIKAESPGSACTSKTLEPSHVLLAIGLAHEEAHGSLVFTMGKQNTQEDVDLVLEVLPDVVKRLRALSPLTPKEILR